MSGPGATNFIPDVFGDDDSKWYACLDACGIAPTTQARTMAPRFTYIRRTRSCLEWLREIIQMQYDCYEETTDRKLNTLSHIAAFEQTTWRNKDLEKSVVHDINFICDLEAMEEGVAEEFAAYAKHRSVHSPIIIIMSSIHFDVLGRLTSQNALFLSAGTNWMQWRLQEYDEAVVVVGPASCKPTAAWTAIESWEHVSRDFVFSVEPSGRPGKEIHVPL
ncbi:hypothetical protein B0T18DRAFT_392304 [Schizothecium vesticola]|uniref:Uncharacterized protein n=1 Tax=Schizothecium vesticola TaxID=314040 RepID=A0AA40K2G4_9PEZI|nr:hypothetical protein B0T18DRAFT_392304 [Schizothecium vesticola]